MYAVQYGKEGTIITHTVTSDIDSAVIAIKAFITGHAGFRRILYSNGLNLILDKPEFNQMAWIRAIEPEEQLDIII